LSFFEIAREAVTETVIQKSRFIGILSPVYTEEDALGVLNGIRKQHRDARHHCYAYILGAKRETMRMSDDGEPQGTAGVPMLEVLKQSNLTNAIMVCVRYFGGILLGAGGLTRAYAGSAAQTVKAADKLAISYADAYRIITTYPVWSRLESYFSQHGIGIGEVTYAERVTAQVSEKEGQGLIVKAAGEIGCGGAICEFYERITVKTPIIDDKR
jgi:uncharacterized YigZ family protein